MREPWRNLYAHLRASIGWEDFSANHANLDVFADLAARPLTALDQMMRQNINTPLASSCGRLFDAVAAALKFCRDRQSYEGQAAALLEAAADMASNPDGYPFSIDTQSGLPKISPTPMWRALLADLQAGTPASLIAARFHTGLAGAIAAMAQHLADGAPKFDTIALSGGCFQNRILAEAIEHRLASAGFTILSHAEIPANDGGLSLGQAAIAAALMLRG
jgi:hydrogenase maturation protein HypF